MVQYLPVFTYFDITGLEFDRIALIIILAQEMTITTRFFSEVGFGVTISYCFQRF